MPLKYIKRQLKINFYRGGHMLHVMQFSKLNNLVNRCGAGASTRAFHAAGPIRSPVGTSFLGEVFGVFLTCKKNQEALGPQGPRISFGPHNHPFIFALLE